LPAAARPPTSETPYTSWDRARLSVVVPIGVIVAVAIVCIVVAVLSSAQRADEVAIEHETKLFSTALNNYSARVLREARALSKLAHPNVVAIHDADSLDGTIYIVMELAPGKTLRAWLENSPGVAAVWLNVETGLPAGVTEKVWVPIVPCR